MNVNLDINSLGSTLSKFLHRFHIVIFVLVVIGGLSVATFLLSTAMNPSSSAAAPATPVSPAAQAAGGTTVLDTETIKKVKALRTDSAPLVLPPGRTNPFN